MRLHKEGAFLIPLFFVLIAGALIGIGALTAKTPVWWLLFPLGVAGAVFFGLVVNFFRNPKVEINKQEMGVISPCEGKVVVIEEVEDKLYFNAKVRQISIFMSPLNVHVNRNPIGGEVKYHKYFPGKYLVAWHPKSSTDNEQTFFVVENDKMTVGFKQIAGAVARRIRWYINTGDQVKQGEEMGFIKFGSRMDVLIPLDMEVTVELEQDVKAGETLLAIRR